MKYAAQNNVGMWLKYPPGTGYSYNGPQYMTKQQAMELQGYVLGNRMVAIKEEKDEINPLYVPSKRRIRL